MMRLAITITLTALSIQTALLSQSRATIAKSTRDLSIPGFDRYVRCLGYRAKVGDLQTVTYIEDTVSGYTIVFYVRSRMGADAFLPTLKKPIKLINVTAFDSQKRTLSPAFGIASPGIKTNPQEGATEGEIRIRAFVTAQDLTDYASTGLKAQFTTPWGRLNAQLPPRWIQGFLDSNYVLNKTRIKDLKEQRLEIDSEKAKKYPGRRKQYHKALKDRHKGLIDDKTVHAASDAEAEYRSPHRALDRNLRETLWRLRSQRTILKSNITPPNRELSRSNRIEAIKAIANEIDKTTANLVILNPESKNFRPTYVPSQHRLVGGR